MRRTLTLGLVLGTAALALAVRAAQSGDRDVPRLGAETDVTTPVLTGASGEQTEPRAAWDGKQILVTWRSSFWKDELRATRLSPTGEVLDGRGLPVAPRERNAGSAPVAAGSGGFLVAYVEDPARVVVLRASADGGLRMGRPLAVFERPDDHAPSDPAVTFSAPHFWVVWSRQSATSSAVVAARVRFAESFDDGVGLTALDTTPVELGAGFGPVAAATETPATAGAAPTTWALWGVRGAAGMVELRLSQLGSGQSSAGAPAGGLLLLAAAGERVESVALAVGGGQRAAAASIVRPDGTHEVRVTRFSPDGQALDAAAAPLVSGVRLRGGPTLAWQDGGTFSVHWSVELDEAGRKVPSLRAATFPAVDPSSPSAPARAFPDAAVSRAGRQPILVAGGPQPLLIWEEIVRWTAANDPADSDIRATPLVATGAAAAPSPAVVSLATNWQSEPNVAWSGRRALVVFEDGREDKAGTDVYGARLELSATGLRPLDGPGIPLGTGPASQHAPAVAWDGVHFVVAWVEGPAGLALARVSEEGVVLHPSAQRVTGTEGHALLAEPVLCQTGEGALLVWAARRTASSPDTELWGLPLPRGRPASPGDAFLLARTPDTTFAPVLRLGCHDQAALLVWSGLKRADRPSELQAGRILPGARGFAPQPGMVTLAERVTEEWAGIATDGREFLVAWRGFNERNMRTVFAARLDGEGRVVERSPVAVGQSNSGRRVTALWDGRQYVVMAVNTEGGNPFELRGRRLSSGVGGLRVLDPDWFRVATLSKPWGGGGPGAEGLLVSPGQLLVTYEQYPEDDASSNPRARARLLEIPVRAQVITPDAGAPADGGAADGGAAPDATIPDAPTSRTAGSGCSCHLEQGPAGATAPWPPLLISLAIILRRRKRRPLSPTLSPLPRGEGART